MYRPSKRLARQERLLGSKALLHTAVHVIHTQMRTFPWQHRSARVVSGGTFNTHAHYHEEVEGAANDVEAHVLEAEQGSGITFCRCSQTETLNPRF